MAQRNSAARLALVIGILVVAAGIYMLWRHTRFMVERDAHKSDGTRLIRTLPDPPRLPEASIAGKLRMEDRG